MATICLCTAFSCTGDPISNAPVQAYWDDGSPKVQGSLEGSTRIGQWHEYHENGVLWSSSTYENGRLYSSSIYDENSVLVIHITRNGSLIRTDVYEDGQRISKMLSSGTVTGNFQRALELVLLHTSEEMRTQIQLAMIPFSPLFLFNAAYEVLRNGIEGATP